MTLDEEDVRLITNIVREVINSTGPDEIRRDEAKKIFGISSERALYEIAQQYPEIKPGGKNAHFFSRGACLRVARVRAAKRAGRL